MKGEHQKLQKTEQGKDRHATVGPPKIGPPRPSMAAIDSPSLLPMLPWIIACSSHT